MHHIQNTQDFVEQVKNITLGTGKCITSYNMIALFTSVAIGPALNIIHNKLGQDQELAQRTKLTIQHIIELLGFFLHNAYLIFQGKYYEQVEGAAIGSQLTP